jgi:hypothetical protein
MRAPALASLGFIAACSGSGADSGGTAPVEARSDDRDGDTIADLVEGDEDADADGSPNSDDLDSDGDGIEDRIEAGDRRIATLPFDTDNDGTADFLDLDSDANCIADAIEGEDDLDSDSIVDALDPDDDGDGILDAIEIGDACGIPDADDDGIADYRDADSDGDGILDLYEAGINTEGGAPQDTDDDGVADYLDTDADGDGRSDTDEAGPDGDPLDSDGDGSFDFEDFDNDGDGVADADEIASGLDPDDADSDGDGQTDLVERLGNSNPLDSNDRFEGLVFVVPERSVVEDAIPYEISLRRIDLGMLIDVTTSMVTAAPASVADLLTMARTLTAKLYDPHVGVAVFSEFSASPMSSGGGDVPFRLDQQLTADLDEAWAAMKDVSIIWGGNVDWAEASIEALHQAITGEGYDLDCDGTYSASKDVLPFISSKDDPFGGDGGQAYNPLDDSTGEVGGMGFRASAIPILLLVTDADMRDPEAGYAVPGGCPGEAGMSDVIDELNDLGGFFIGLSVSGELAVPQMTEICVGTGSYGDPGTGSVPLVFSYTPGDEEFLDQLVAIIADLGEGFEIDQMWPEVVDDPLGFVTDIGPAYDDVSAEHEDGDIIEFELSLLGAAPAAQDDTAYLIEIHIVSERGVVDEMDVIVVVPARTP